jgi:multidrug efflux system membrane fusion protein
MRLQATLANPDRRLLPGMFANARVVMPPRPEVVSVPETAVNRTLYGDSVFVVAEDGKDAQGKPKLKAVQTFVEAGDRFDGRVAIERGIAAGDLVVASGQLKLQNGAPVTVASDGLVPPATAPVE